MDTKWTSGPWLIGEDQCVDETWSIVTTTGGSVVANVNDRHNRLANAHLIATAPDMAPLVEVLASLPIGPNTADDVPLYGLDGVYITHGHVRAARAALAKARGEA